MTSVMLDARYLGRGASGIGRYAREVVAAMQQQRPELEWRFVVRHAGDHRPLAGRDTLVFDAEPYGLATSLWLHRRTGPEPADLFHSPFHVLPRSLACPAVLTMHDVFNFTQPETSNYPFPWSWLEWGYFLAAIPDSLRRAARVVCVSKTTADALAARLPWCAPKLRVIYHGVTARFHPPADPTEAARRCATLLGTDAPFLLSVGAISPNKNHRRMLAAFARAFGGSSRTRLVTVSRFGRTDPLAREARRLGVAQRHVSLPSPSDEDMSALYAGASALAFYSIVEGFGLPVLEAMASGCPVLTSRRSCLPEVAGDAALYADPFDVEEMARQMRRVVAEPELRAELRERGFARAGTFTWQRAAREHLEVYDEALRGA